MSDKKNIQDALKLIFDGIALLRSGCDGRRKFTIDGRLVGDIGEIIAEREFELTLDLKQRRGHDATTSDDRNVQIKAGFGDTLTFGKEPDLYLGLKLYPNGEHEVIYNGPARPIRERYDARKGIDEKLLSFPMKELKKLSDTIRDDQRVRPRKLNF